MWILGTLIGAIVLMPFGHGLWVIGAVLGGFVGWAIQSRNRALEEQAEEGRAAPEQAGGAAPELPGRSGRTAQADEPMPAAGDRLQALETRLVAELADIKRKLDRLDSRLTAGAAGTVAAPPATEVPDQFLRVETQPASPPIATAPAIPPAPAPGPDLPRPAGDPAATEALAAALRSAALKMPRQGAEVRPAPPGLSAAEEAALAAVPAAAASAETTPRAAIAMPESQPQFPPPPPREPTWLEQLPGAVWGWLTGGNTVVRVGVVILFFGVAFLLRYAYEHIQVAIELRLAGVAAGAIALLAFGWRLRTKREGYALTLQAGGVGLLYLTIFAAFRLYNVLPPGIAFAMLVAIAAFSAVLAVLQDSRSIAVLGAAGGFLAPILASTGGGSHVMLFSYYAVLNAGILAIAWFKAWRLLNLVGFAFTFAIGTLWGTRFYKPALFASTEPFLVLFFLFYVAIPLLFARRQAPQLRHYVDGTLVFGVPLVAFGLQLGLVKDFEYGASFSALALAAFYLLLAKTVYVRAGERLRLLAEAFLALGIVFGTLAIPLGLDGRWTAATWALEGAAILWVGVRQQRVVARVFGMLLQVAAGIAFLGDVNRPPEPIPFANSFYLGCFFVAVAGLFTAWYLERRRADVSAPEATFAARAFFLWGIVWWAVGALREVDLHVAFDYRVPAALLYFTVSCVVFSVLQRRLDWPAARYPALALLPIMAIAALATVDRATHPFAHLGWLAWPLAFGAHFVVLRRDEAAPGGYLFWVHAAGFWLLAALGAWEVGWQIDRFVAGRAAWPMIAWALVPGGLLAALALTAARDFWPLWPHRRSYFVVGAAPLAAFLALWVVWVSVVSGGDPWPLPYVPVLNPLGLAQVGAVLAIALWFFEGRRLELEPFDAAQLPIAWGCLAAAAFGWVNVEVLRTVHHWAGVPYRLNALLSSDIVQTAFSIVWTLIALGTMMFATGRRLRVAWMVGAGLMAAVVVKLFLVDLSHVGTVTRIVSFIGVGVLMLLIGYFSPVPPKAREEAA